MKKKALALAGFGLTVLSLTLAAPASARLVYYAILCDASFNSIAVSKGYPACSDMIREEFVKKGIKFINDNTSADTGGVTYYVSGSWSSPAAGSTSGTFLDSADNYSGFEEQSPWHFKIAFTGKQMSDKAGGSFTKWRGGGGANVAVVSYKEVGGANNIVWPSTALHEVTHLLRDDGYHHNDDGSTFRTCVMDRLDYSSYTGIILHEVCSYCRGQINRRVAGW
ncbi:MAG: hypothetical protein KDD47_23325, partial [Acidobacteria bacterium]|nr:hypothetical protein [Acidobacteriota bacterium]